MHFFVLCTYTGLFVGNRYCVPYGGGVNGPIYFASVRTRYDRLIGQVWFLGLFLDRSDRSVVFGTLVLW